MGREREERREDGSSQQALMRVVAFLSCSNLPGSLVKGLNLLQSHSLSVLLPLSG